MGMEMVDLERLAARAGRGDAVVVPSQDHRFKGGPGRHPLAQLAHHFQILADLRKQSQGHAAHRTGDAEQIPGTEKIEGEAQVLLGKICTSGKKQYDPVQQNEDQDADEPKSSPPNDLLFPLFRSLLQGLGIPLVPIQNRILRLSA